MRPCVLREATNDSITNLAIRAGALIDPAGKVIPDLFTARGTIVGTINPDIVNLCDKRLILETVESRQGLTSRDAPSIAHALFKDAPKKISQDDMIDRVHELLSQMSNELEQDKEGVSWQFDRELQLMSGAHL